MFLFFLYQGEAYPEISSSVDKVGMKYRTFFFKLFFRYLLFCLNEVWES